MGYEDELVKLLLDKENIATALEIGDAIEKVKTELRRVFWNTAYEMLKKGLEGNRLAEQWRIQEANDVRTQPNANEGGLTVVRRPADGSLQLNVSVRQSGFRLYHSIGFNERVPFDKRSAHVKELEEKVRQHLKNRTDWTLGWEWTDIYLNQRSWLIDIVSDPESLADQAVHPILDILEKVGPDIARADATLASG